MDRLQAMRVFIHVVDSGGFTRAADVLDLPKASVSQHVSNLEAHLGVRLLHRTTRRLRLTEDGAAYYERAKALLDDVAELEGSLGNASRSPSGRLRIDVPAAFGRHVLAPALPEFAAKYPDIVLEVGSSDRPVHLLEENVDCVIRGGDVHDESLIGRRLMTLDVITCAAPGYLGKHGIPQHPDLLANEHRLIGFFSAKTGRSYPFDFTGDGGTLTVDGPFHLAFNDSDAYIAAAVAGLGIVQTPCSGYVQGLLESKALQRVLEGWTVEALPVSILYPGRRHLSARVRVFVDWAVARLPSHT